MSKQLLTIKTCLENIAKTHEYASKTPVVGSNEAIMITLLDEAEANCVKDNIDLAFEAIAELLGVITLSAQEEIDNEALDAEELQVEEADNVVPIENCGSH